MRVSVIAIPLFVLIGSIAPSSAASQAAPPRDRPGPGSAGTATLRGAVLAADTGQPLTRVRLTLNGALANPLTAVSDTRGTFEIGNVPPGLYTMTATRAGYLTIQYGQRRPREAGRTIDVRDAAVVEHLDIRLPRAASLSGRIVDEAGDPVQGVRVEALEMRSVRGRRLPVQAAYALTNDIGEFRMGGLNPGAYYLRASSTETWTSDDGRESFAYAQTFYPGAATLEDTQPLSIALGQQASGLDFALMPRPAQRITGMLVNAAGEPIAAQRIHLDRIERTAGGALLSAGFGGSAISREDGTFAIAALPPGEYMIYSGDREKDFTQVQVFVADERVGVALTPRRIARVSGAVFAEDGKAPDFPAARIRVLPIALDETLPVWGTPGPQAVRADWTFEIANLDGPFLFRITGLPEPWMLRAVRLGGADVTDAPVQLPPAAGDLKGLQLVLSRTAGGRVSGLVTDAAGAARADSTVVVFGVDSATWTPGSRFVRGVRPADDGRFAASGLPAGRYYAIARDFLAEGEWEDPAFLREAARTAAEFALDPGGSIDLALELPQP